MDDGEWHVATRRTKVRPPIWKETKYSKWWDFIISNGNESTVDRFNTWANTYATEFKSWIEVGPDSRPRFHGRLRLDKAKLQTEVRADASRDTDLNFFVYLTKREKRTTH